jgi:hypothetical protein
MTPIVLGQQALVDGGKRRELKQMALRTALVNTLQLRMVFLKCKLDVNEGFYMDQKKLFILLNCGTDELRSDQVKRLK